MRCPYCAAPNHAGVSFCIECGEPLDAESLAAWAARGPAAAPVAPLPAPTRRRGFPHPRLGWEMVLGLALLLVVLGADAISTAQQAAHDAQVAALRRGIAASDARHWVEAESALRAAGDYADAPQRLAQVELTLRQLRTLYSEADAAAGAGAWWEATLDYAATAALQPDYEQVATRLATARAAAGPIVYRQTIAGAALGGPALWWTTADGADPRPILGTTAQTVVHALSPDGHWVIYSNYIADAAHPGARRIYLFDLRTGAVHLLTPPPDTAPGVISAQFRADGSGVWCGLDDRLYYVALTGDLPVRLTLQAAAPDIVAADPLTGSTIRLTADSLGPRGAALIPGFGDATLPGAVGEAAAARFVDATGIRIWVGDALGQQARLLAYEPGAVTGLTLSPDGRFLLYRTPVANADGRNVTDSWILIDQQALRADPGAPAGDRQVIAQSLSLRDGLLQPTLSASFLPVLPGQPARLLLTPFGLPPWIYNPLTHSHQVLDVPTDEVGWRLASGPYVVSPSGHWLGLDAWMPAGAASLSKLIVRSATGGPAWTLLVPTDRPIWLGFSGDERYVFYSLRRSEPDGRLHTFLVSLPTPDGQGGPTAAEARPLLDRQWIIPGWDRGVGLTPDGRRVLALLRPGLTSAVPGAPDHYPGLYALRPDGTDWLALAPGATEYWIPNAQYWSAEGGP